MASLEEQIRDSRVNAQALHYAPKRGLQSHNPDNELIIDGWGR
jgi:hypothetical protein